MDTKFPVPTAVLEGELERLRQWQTDAVQLLKDEKATPAEWLARKDDLLRRARKA